jgi:hypothetical protein
MIGCLFRIVMSIILLAASIIMLARPGETWPLIFVFCCLAIALILSAFGSYHALQCPECGKRFARGEIETIEHPVRFWHANVRITRYKPCKECKHRMDVEKKVYPRYWFTSGK